MEGTEYLETVSALKEKLYEAEANKTTSDEINKLAEALSKAQGMIEGAKKDSENPFFKSSYADLASVWDACREALSKNNLAVVQTTTEVQPPFVCIETTLMHSSGQWIKGSLTMKSTKEDPQGMGSAITYARRYALSAIVGIAPEDDDGNEGSGKGGKDSKKNPPKNKADSVKPKNEPKEKSPREKLKDAIHEICGGDEKYFAETLRECSKFIPKGEDKEIALTSMAQIDDSKTNETWIKASLGAARKFLKENEGS